MEVKEEHGRRFSELVAVLVDFILNRNSASHRDISYYGSVVAIEVINKITNILRSNNKRPKGMTANICHLFSILSKKNPFLSGIIQNVSY